MNEKDLEKAKSAVDWKKQDVSELAKVHGIPVIRSPHVKEMTLIVPEEWEISRPTMDCGVKNPAIHCRMPQCLSCNNK